MRALPLIVCVVLLFGCDSAPPPTTNLTDRQVVDALKQAGIPIGATTFYTAETDKNNLLGRPNGYKAKASWHDTRLAPPTDTAEIDVDDGAGIEIFEDTADAQKRMDYIQALAKELPLLAEYDYVHGPILLRVSKSLTPVQASEYEQALRGITIKP